MCWIMKSLEKKPIEKLKLTLMQNNLSCPDYFIACVESFHKISYLRFNLNNNNFTTEDITDLLGAISKKSK